MRIQGIQENGSIDREAYRTTCELCTQDWSEADQRQLRSLLASDFGVHLVKHLALREVATMLSAAKSDFSTEEGIKQAIKAQGKAQGFTLAVEAIFDMTEIWS